MKKNLFILIGIVLSAYSYGQGEIDALRFSKTELSGTARGQAMGGAFGALGGDVTGIAINPAGIGVYRTSELNGTLSLNAINTESTWQKNSPSKGDKISFNLENISYVGYCPIGDESLQSINFGFSYNKIKNFNRNYSAKGKNMNTSLTDYIEHETSSLKIPETALTEEPYERYPNEKNAPWLSILGYRGYLINPVENGYESTLEPGETVNPYLNISETGYIDKYDFTVGANFSNSFYLGMTFTCVDIDYRIDSNYGENFLRGGGFVLDSYRQTEGSGYQFNIGAIWRPSDWLRMGIAYHSPTWYVMKDFYQGILDADVPMDDTGKRPLVEETPNGNFEYRFHTPHKWVFSAAAVLGTKAIVSMDYEITNYGAMNLKDVNGYEFQNDNDFIRQDFRNASVLRSGIEYRFTSQFSGRLGYGWQQNPYEKNFKNNKTQAVIAGVLGTGTIPHYTIEGDVNYFTAGIGYRFTPNFYIDFALVNRIQTDELYFFPYLETNRPNYIENKEETHQFIPYYPQASSLKNVSFKGLMTLGYKF
jgi:long-subunit fatty acid transport protein